MKAALRLLLIVLVLAGCGPRYIRRPVRPVSIDERPVPAADTTQTAAAEDATKAQPPAEPAEPPPAPKPVKPPLAGEKPPADNGSPPPAPVGSVMSDEERRATLARIDADTTAAGAAVRKCGNRQLLPDQESVLETTRSLLDQTRAALAGNELWRAESLARKARQLAASLVCPG